MGNIRSVIFGKNSSFVSDSSLKAFNPLRLEVVRNENTDFEHHQYRHTECEHSFLKNAPININYKLVTCSISQWRKDDVKILDNVSGSINAGELTAILGLQGSGKTVLMKILAGHKLRSIFKKFRITGSVLINAQKELEGSFYKMFCYIMKDYYLFLKFTVMETMMLAANLKCSNMVSEENKRKMIENLLKNWKLDMYRDKKVLNLTYGQRKCLCIAQELLSNPSVIFLEEPTSDLDHSSCCQYIALLKTLAYNGKIVICTLTQPASSVFKYFDHIIFLAKGKCIYQGKRVQLISFLSSMNLQCPMHFNLSDFVNDIISKEDGKYINLLAAENEKRCKIMNSDAGGTNFEGAEESSSELKYENYNFWNTFQLLFRREFFSLLRDKEWLLIRFAFHVTTGIILGAMCLGIGKNAKRMLNNGSCLFFSQLVPLVSAALIILKKYPVERNIIIREQLNCWYGLRLYYFAKIVAELPFQFMLSITFASIVYWMSSQPAEWFRILYFQLFSVSVSAVAFVYGLMISSGTSDKFSMFLGGFGTLPFLALSGFFVRLKDFSYFLQSLSYLSYVRHAFEGVLITVYGFERSDLHCNETTCLFPEPKSYLKDMGFTNTNISINFVGFFVSFIIFVIGGYFTLRYRIPKKRVPRSF